jgi:HEAT repeat protein
VSETHVEIPDDSGPPPESDSPYKNLWVPLVLVPAGIVIAIVLVFVLFGSALGEEATMSQNLQTVVDGGANERDQAAFGLVRQALENQQARAEGVELPWPLEEGFARQVSSAADQLAEDDHILRLALGILLDLLGDDAGVELLIATLALDESQDPGAKLRFYAVWNLGLIADARAAPAVLKLLDGSDEGLRNLAAGVLCNLPGEGVREGLVMALGDDSLAVRASAAASLSKLDPPDGSAARLLRDLTETSIYTAENARFPQKYRVAEEVSDHRVVALRALGRLGLAEDRALLEALTKDSDLNVADGALKVLADWDK